MSGWISLRNWEKFQHYKDRDPPWVKLYRDLLSGEAWVLGTDQSRLVQVASILIAARYSNHIPMKWGLILKVCCLDMSEQELCQAIERLAAADFLEVHHNQQDTANASVSANGVAQSASNALASCTSEAEQRRDREETEKSKRARIARPAKPPPRKRCPEDFEITQDLKDWAQQQAPDVDIAAELSKFRDWEFKSGHTDWPATWRTWMRRAQETAKPKVNGHDPAVKVWDELLASEGALPKRTEQIQTAIEACGGWMAIRGRTAFEEPKLKFKFCEAYRGH